METSVYIMSSEVYSPEDGRPIGLGKISYPLPGSLTCRTPSHAHRTACPNIMNRSRPLTATLPLLLAACGPGADEGDGRPQTTDAPSSGETVVRNTADPIWKAETAWRVVEELRIGEAKNEGPDLFASILSFDVDTRGRIYVLDDHA